MHTAPILWKCPACSTSLQHDGELRPGSIYRCHVCHLELIADLVTEQVVLVPLSPREHTDRERPE
jgi:hypothetical protein